MTQGGKDTGTVVVLWNGNRYVVHVGVVLELGVDDCDVFVRQRDRDRVCAGFGLGLGRGCCSGSAWLFVLDLRFAMRRKLGSCGACEIGICCEALMNWRGFVCVCVYV